MEEVESRKGEEGTGVVEGGSLEYRKEEAENWNGRTEVWWFPYREGSRSDWRKR